MTTLKTVLLFLFLASYAFSQSTRDARGIIAIPVKPPGTNATTIVDLTAAEIDYLKAQLALANQQLEISNLPQVMQARLTALVAAEKLKAAQEAAKPKPDPK